ncbi:MAG: NAD(P)/FAD-dependent oxidoreductase [Saprospiraceae bacterium]
MQEIQTDFLIVGQGLAGSLLAWFLAERGQRVHIVDNDHEYSSSVVAAGIINPVTGRRLVKSWMIDELLPVAKSTYLEIEKKLSISIYQERVIYRALADVKAENVWDERSGDQGYEQYLGAEKPEDKIRNLMNPPFSWGAIHKAAQVDIPTFLETIEDYFTNKKQFSRTTFNYDDLKFLENGDVFCKLSNDENQVENIIAKQVIFCEGQRARFNPWFGNLPFVVSKGEMLEVKIEGGADLPIVKHKAYLAPLQDSKLWIGATYEWNELDEEPTEKARTQLIKNLEKSITVPYEIVKQNAAIRPTVKDRRPFLGTHSKHATIHIFNGLGTKGTSLGPYWGQHFVDYLLQGKQIDSAVDIKRFDGNGK